MNTTIPFGLSQLDRALGGGIKAASVNLLYGEEKTGKTTVALQLAINCAQLGYKVLFLDCDNTFSTKRLRQISSESFEVAELILVIKPQNFGEQSLVISQLEDYVNAKFGLIILDSITSLYRISVAVAYEKTFSLNRELNRQMALLAQASKICKIGIVVTSQVRSNLDRNVDVGVQPIATRVLKFWSDTIIALNRTDQSQVIRFTLEKPQKVKSADFYLAINKKGINELLN